MTHIHGLQVMKFPEAVPFSAPVTDKQAPGYSTIVQHPMDLGAIRDKLDARAYVHPADAYADVRQVSHPSPLLHRGGLNTSVIFSSLCSP
jgi:hypothetical protein